MGHGSRTQGLEAEAGRLVLLKFNGKQVKLPDKAEAERAMHALLAQETPEPEAVTSLPAFRKLADLFIDQSLRVNKPTTSKMHRLFLQSFRDRIGRKRVSDLKVHHVSEWIAAKTTWGSSTASSARGTVLACLNWAVEQGYIPSHPLGRLKRGSHKRRERVFTVEEMGRIKAHGTPDFADFIVALELTGARPFSELATVTAAMVDWQEGTIRFGQHKNEKKGKSRTIYLVPDLLALLRRLAARRPTGLLFRNVRGRMMTSHDASRRLRYVTEKLGIPRGTIYAIRHRMITSALEKGLNANVIAELVGNSPITISRNYDHLSQQKASMRAAALKAVS
jgi:integrase